MIDIWRAAPSSYAAYCSEGKFQIFKHIEYLEDQILDALYNGGGRFIVTLPPRHGKSEYLSKWLPAWYLDTFDDRNVILTSYGDDLATGFGRWVRNHFALNEHCISTLSEDSTAANRFKIDGGGEMITAGIGGPITGRGGHLLLIDDPFKNWSEANSARHRQAVRDWFDTTFYTRQEPQATIIVVQTRWHHDDLAGYLLENHSDEWKLINLPAIAEEDDALGRPIGEALCPERYDESALKDIEEGIPSQHWNSLYQQRPSKQEGELFKREWWQYYDSLPSIIEKVQFWDTASKPGLSNDFSICATWGRAANGFYLLDLFKDKLEAPDLEQAILQQYNKHLPSAVQIEDKSSGIAMIQYLQAKTTIPVIPYNPGQKDKELRAINATPLAKSKRLFLPRQESWVSDFIEEHSNFPNGVHDDQVDTTSQMAEYFSKPILTQPRIRRL